MPIPTITPTQFEEPLENSNTVIRVALSKDHVRTILSGLRSAGWICDLQSTMQSMVENGELNVQTLWNCTGAVTMTVDVSDYDIEATDADQAMEIFTELVADDWESYAQGTTDFNVEDVDAEQA